MSGKRFETDVAYQEQLTKVHTIVRQQHWGKNASIEPWPKTPAEWRQTSYDAPWDANVHMAEWHLATARKLKEAGLI